VDNFFGGTFAARGHGKKKTLDGRLGKGSGRNGGGREDYAGVNGDRRRPWSEVVDADAVGEKRTRLLLRQRANSTQAFRASRRFFKLLQSKAAQRTLPTKSIFLRRVILDYYRAARRADAPPCLFNWGTCRPVFRGGKLRRHAAAA